VSEFCGEHSGHRTCLDGFKTRMDRLELNQKEYITKDYLDAKMQAQGRIIIGIAVAVAIRLIVLFTGGG